MLFVVVLEKKKGSALYTQPFLFYKINWTYLNHLFFLRMKLLCNFSSSTPSSVYIFYNFFGCLLVGSLSFLFLFLNVQFLLLSLLVFNFFKWTFPSVSQVEIIFEEFTGSGILPSNKLS